MNAQQEQIRETQKAAWNKFSPGWKKWDAFNMGFLQPVGAEIIDRLRLQEGDEVLDLATGTGEPGLTIAALVGGGRVVGTDLAEEMLTIAEENAAAKGIKNYTTKIADTCELPFADESFDAVSCRMGFMFFPDMELAAREIYRVLRPGGRMAVSVWGAPQKNVWIATMMKAVGDNITLPPPVPGAPGMFRCSAPGLMTGLLTGIGFTAVEQQEIEGQADYGNGETYWEMMMDVAAPVVAAMSGASETTREKIRNDLFQALAEKTNAPETLRLGYSAIVVFGKK